MLQRQPDFLLDLVVRTLQTIDTRLSTGFGGVHHHMDNGDSDMPQPTTRTPARQAAPAARPAAASAPRAAAPAARSAAPATRPAAAPAPATARPAPAVVRPAAAARPAPVAAPAVRSAAPVAPAAPKVTAPKRAAAPKAPEPEFEGFDAAPNDGFGDLAAGFDDGFGEADGDFGTFDGAFETTEEFPGEDDTGLDGGFPVEEDAGIPAFDPEAGDAFEGGAGFEDGGFEADAGAALEEPLAEEYTEAVEDVIDVPYTVKIKNGTYLFKRGSQAWHLDSDTGEWCKSDDLADVSEDFVKRASKNPNETRDQLEVVFDKKVSGYELANAKDGPNRTYVVVQFARAQAFYIVLAEELTDLKGNPLKINYPEEFLAAAASVIETTDNFDTEAGFEEEPLTSADAGDGFAADDQSQPSGDVAQLLADIQAYYDHLGTLISDLRAQLG